MVLLSTIKKYITDFYKSLHSPRANNIQYKGKEIQNAGSEEIPEIDYEELTGALLQMKNGRSTGEDCITNEILKMDGESLGDCIRML